MKINIQINQSLEEESIDFHLKAMSPKIERIIDLLQEQGTVPDVLPVLKEEKSFIINIKEIAYVFVENEECKIVVGDESYIYKGTLKSFEETYGEKSFVRISKFCLANIHWIHYYEASFKGSLAIVFKNNHKEYVSRNYTKALKERILSKK